MISLWAMGMRDPRRWSTAGVTGAAARIARGLLQQVAGTGAGHGHEAEGAPMNEATHEERHVARRDAGWVLVLAVDAQTPRGRGQLMISAPQAEVDEHEIDAQLESYTPEGPLLEPGEDVVLMSEQANEHYPARVQSCGDGVVVLDWNAGELPAALRELGGD